MTTAPAQPVVPKKAKFPAKGIHLDIPAEQYHSLHGFSKSWSDKLRTSPAHLFDAVTRGPLPSTPTQIIGTAVHCCALEPDRYKAQYIVGPDVDARTKIWKTFKEAAEKKNLSVQNVRDSRWVQAIADRIRSHPAISELLKEPHWIEPSVIWDIDGYVCKCRPDLVSLDRRIIVDPKTTKDGSPIGFAKEIARYHYHTQAAWYLDLMSMVTGKSWDEFWFVAAEKKRPFLSSVYTLKRGSDAYKLGRDEYTAAFELYRTCMKSGVWPGYSDEVMPVELPEWAGVPGHEQTPESEDESFN